MTLHVARCGMTAVVPSSAPLRPDLVYGLLISELGYIQEGGVGSAPMIVSCGTVETWRRAGPRAWLIVGPATIQTAGSRGSLTRDSGHYYDVDGLKYGLDAAQQRGCDDGGEAECMKVELAGGAQHHAAAPEQVDGKPALGLDFFWYE